MFFDRRHTPTGQQDRWGQEIKLPKQALNWGKAAWCQDIFTLEGHAVRGVSPIRSCIPFSDGSLTAVIQHGLVRLIDTQQDMRNRHFEYNSSHGRLNVSEPVPVSAPHPLGSNPDSIFLFPHGEKGILQSNNFSHPGLKACHLPAVDMRIGLGSERKSTLASGSIISIDNSNIKGSSVVIIGTNSVPYMIFDTEELLSGMRHVQNPDALDRFSHIQAKGLLRHAPTVGKLGAAPVPVVPIESKGDVVGIIYGMAKDRGVTDKGHVLERHFFDDTEPSPLVPNGPEVSTIHATGRDLDTGFLYVGGKRTGYIAKIGLSASEPFWENRFEDLHTIQKLAPAHSTLFGKVVVGINNSGKLFVLDDSDGTLCFTYEPTEVLGALDYHSKNFSLVNANFFITEDGSGSREIIYILNLENSHEGTRFIKISLDTFEISEVESPIAKVWPTALHGETITCIEQSLDVQEDNRIHLTTYVGTNLGRMVAYSAPLS